MVGGRPEPDPSLPLLQVHSYISTLAFMLTWLVFVLLLDNERSRELCILARAED